MLGLLSLPAHAFRTAVFPSETRDRVVFWADSAKLPAQLPVWLHAGDSVASGWATKSTLRERVEEAAKAELPEAGSFTDLMRLVPSPRFPWYGGSEIQLGFLGHLERASARPWGVVSVALAGALVTKTEREDALAHLEQIAFPERVRLVSWTYGHNDICSDVDATEPKHRLRERVRALKVRFPNARWLAWDILDIVGSRTAVFDALEALPAGVARDRTMAYCEKSWNERNCPLAHKDPARANELRAKLRELYREEFGELFSPEREVLSKLTTLDAVAADCFHPSRLTQGQLSQALADFLPNP